MRRATPASDLRGKNAEVRYMHIAANLDLKPGDCRCAEVLRHNRSCAAQKCEGRRQHPGVTYGNEFLEPGLGLGLKDGDRIFTVRRWFELSQACRGYGGS